MDLGLEAADVHLLEGLEWTKRAFGDQVMPWTCKAGLSCRDLDLALRCWLCILHGGLARRVSRSLEAEEALAEALRAAKAADPRWRPRCALPACGGLPAARRGTRGRRHVACREPLRAREKPLL